MACGRANLAAPLSRLAARASRVTRSLQSARDAHVPGVDGPDGERPMSPADPGQPGGRRMPPGQRDTAGAAPAGRHRKQSLPGRMARAWKASASDRRLAATAAVGLCLTLFLPWYQVTVIATGRAAALQSKSVALSGWAAFSFVEAAVLVVAAAVLVLLFKRAEGRAFHLPGGDGAVIMAAGLWASLLIVWRIFDKQGAHVTGPGATASGIEWGIFVALAVGIGLVYSGSAIRAAHRPEPPLPGEDERTGPAPGGEERSGAVARGEEVTILPSRITCTLLGSMYLRILW